MDSALEITRASLSAPIPFEWRHTRRSPSAWEGAGIDRPDLLGKRVHDGVSNDSPGDGQVENIGGDLGGQPRPGSFVRWS
jgi:hypothetical protein